ncbi:hypothetical protein [Streptomyces sp. NPDC007172]|uniref:hypothetical protein n=1 Tax=Streptomyces sp. NPDC007172 TaxID=3364776 RepID=UPI003682AEC2
MIFRTLFLYAMLPGYGVWLARSVWTAHRRTPETAPRRPAPFWLQYLKGCAGFPLLCIALVSLMFVWTGRIP